MPRRPSTAPRTNARDRAAKTDAREARDRAAKPPARRPRRQRANPTQLSFCWGGAREGAGRPARGPIVSERHTTRPVLVPWFPVHVVARVDPSVRALGRRDAYTTIRRAVKLSLARTNFRIVRLAIHARHLELLVEADDKHALARGMQGFQVSAARAVNRAARRTGTVFPDRYRMTILRTRGAARAAIGGHELRTRSAARAAIGGHDPHTRDTDLHRNARLARTDPSASAPPRFVAPASAETAILLACLGRSPRTFEPE